MALDDDQVELISDISVAISVFSCIGSAFIVFCYLYFKHLRTFAFKLVFILSCNDFFNQAYTESFFELSSVLWTTAIAAHLYMSVFRRMSLKQVEATFIWMTVVCYGIPAILTMIPGIIGAYGVAGGWCWITDAYSMWRFYQFYIPLWIAILFNSYVYIKVIGMLSTSSKAGGVDAETAAQMAMVVRRLKFYPLILLVVWFWATINRIYEASADEQVFWLFLLQRVFSSMQGFFNAFAYGMSGSIRRALKETLSSRFPCCFKDDPGLISNLPHLGGVNTRKHGTLAAAALDSDDGDDMEMEMADMYEARSLPKPDHDNISGSPSPPHSPEGEEDWSQDQHEVRAAVDPAAVDARRERVDRMQRPSV